MIDSIISSFALPPNTLISQRVSKKLLLENGASTTTDKRSIQDEIEELLWIAVLKPTTIGVPVWRDATHEYLEIELLVLTLRAEAKPPRLLELIHRAIPYPVILVAEQANLATLSLAHKRLSQIEAGQTVIESLEISPLFDVKTPARAESAFLTSLALASQPQQNLQALYQGWMDRVIAFRAAPITKAFTLRDSPAQTEQRRLALEEHARLQREIASLRAQAEKEPQINRRVDLNLEIRRLEARLAYVVANL